MARPSKNATIDYTTTHALTHGLLDRAACSDELAFVLVRDADKRGLRLRVTRAGGKHWQFETRLRNRQLFTRTIGEWPTISIEDAKAEAHRLRGLTEKGIDPRDIERQQKVDKAAQVAAAQAQALTVGDLWPRYLAEGRPKRKDAWKPGYRASLDVMSAPGGVPKKRGKGLTRPGPLYPLLALKLADLTEDALQIWFEREAVAGKVEQTRTIPLTPYLAHLFATLPRANAFVFASASKAGRISDARSSHKKALQSAGIEHLTFHGLRRTFTQRGRSVVPAGAVAQIAGHKPSATAEGYAVLPLDDLRPYAALIEARILEQAGINFEVKAEPGKLQLVAG